MLNSLHTCHCIPYCMLTYSKGYAQAELKYVGCSHPRGGWSLAWQLTGTLLQTLVNGREKSYLVFTLPFKSHPTLVHLHPIPIW